MAWFFTSDPHFNHKRIIEHSHRPFASVEAMNETIITRINERVGKGDQLVICGDFAFGNKAAAMDILRRLNGQIHMIRGNHDSVAWSFRDRFASFRDLAEFKVNGRCVIACHYSLRTWNKAHHGAIHVYGHSHGTLGATVASMDVGVDTNDFYPYSADEVFASCDSRPWVAVDHHTAEVPA